MLEGRVIAVDTNVLLRRLLNDDATQAEKARRLFETQESVLVADVAPLGAARARPPRILGRLPRTGWRYLRVVTLGDKVTIHNAFLDRGFEP